jgi:protein tyrosine/serine phosphatase
MPSSDEPQGAARAALEGSLAELSGLLDAGQALLIHCSAGIHRTGMIAYALLRSRGLDRDQALAIIGQTRTHTRDGIRKRHLQWGDDIATRQPR